MLQSNLSLHLLSPLNLSLTSNDSMPPGIENDDYDSEVDMLILEELLSNNPLSLPEKESFHFKSSSSSRPHAKPSDNDEINPNSKILTVKVVDDISKLVDKLFSDEDNLQEIYSNPLFDEEIISIKIYTHYFNAESDLIESLLNHDSSIISSSSKIDSLLDEIFSENSDAAIESFSPSPIPVEDSDSFMEEFDLSLTLDDSMPPGIENDDYDSEVDMLILEELLSNNSLLLPEKESFHFKSSSSSRPHAKPSDNDEIKPNSKILTVKVVDDISKLKPDDDLWREHSYLGCSISSFLLSLTNSSMGGLGQAKRP
nr:hypothetical protein [Tanacetum cinerariifolium]